MTMLAITKFLTWNGNTCTTVHLQLPLHLTDVLLFSVSRPGAAVGKGKKKRITDQAATATFLAVPRWNKEDLAKGRLGLYVA